MIMANDKEIFFCQSKRKNALQAVVWLGGRFDMQPKILN